MADVSRKTRWLETLEASFEASLARDEEVAARDLAFSLAQDRDLGLAAQRMDGCALLLEGGAALQVTEIGLDYLRADTVVAPLGRAIVRAAPEAPAPVRAERKLLELLNGACRSGALVEVRTSQASFTGRLETVGRDHLGLAGSAGAVLIALGRVLEVRLGGAGYSVSRGFSGSC